MDNLIQRWNKIKAENNDEDTKMINSKTSERKLNLNSQVEHKSLSNSSAINDFTFKRTSNEEQQTKQRSINKNDHSSNSNRSNSNSVSAARTSIVRAKPTKNENLLIKSSNSVGSNNRNASPKSLADMTKKEEVYENESLSLHHLNQSTADQNLKLASTRKEHSTEEEKMISLLINYVKQNSTQLDSHFIIEKLSELELRFRQVTVLKSILKKTEEEKNILQIKAQSAEKALKDLELRISSSEKEKIELRSQVSNIQQHLESAVDNSQKCKI